MWRFIRSDVLFSRSRAFCCAEACTYLRATVQRSFSAANKAIPTHSRGKRDPRSLGIQGVTRTEDAGPFLILCKLPRQKPDPAAEDRFREEIIIHLFVVLAAAARGEADLQNGNLQKKAVLSLLEKSCMCRTVLLLCWGCPAREIPLWN